MSSASSACRDFRHEARFCKCGMETKLVMSWSREHAGRRFLGCRNYGGTGFCGFQMWYDEPTPDRLRAIIYGLLKKLNFHENEASSRRKKNEDEVVKLGY